MKTALASSAVALISTAHAASAPGTGKLPVAVFSKVYQTLNLNFAEAAALTAEAGLEGIDCPVRPGGEVLPERVAEDLPRYAADLQKYKCHLLLLTTAITSTASPQTEQVLRTAKKLGVPYYRLGFIDRAAGAAAEKQITEVKAALKDVAALNREIGIGALFQNHSPSGHTYLGGDLAELYEIVKDFDPAQIGVAFDIGHALVVHGDGWRPHFEKLKSHLKVAYVKDVKSGRDWVPFGEGQLGQCGYFKLLKQTGYHAPLSLHIEFDWTDKGKSKNRPALLKALRESKDVLNQWLA